VATVFASALPLEFLGFEAWPVYAGYLCLFGLGWFGSAEWAAEIAVRYGLSGTKTSWIFWKIDTTDGFDWGLVGRVLYGVLIGATLWWRLPDMWYSDEFIAIYFSTWLPYHYIKPGIRGPWEWIASALNRLFT
jgi:hypothetical protein